MQHKKAQPTNAIPLMMRFDATIDRCIRKLIRGIGVNVLDVDYKPGIPLFFLVLLVIAFLFCCLQTIAFSDAEKRIETFTFLAIALQAPVKLNAAVNGRFAYRRLLDSCRRAYEFVNRQNDSALTERAEQFFTAFYIIINVQCLLVLGACGLVMAFPLVCYAMGITYQPVLPADLPGFDVSAGYGYWVNVVFDVVCVMAAACGILPSDAGFLILVLHAYLMSMVLRYEVDRLNVGLRANHGKKRRGGVRMSECVRRFRDILKQHSDYYL